MSWNLNENSSADLFELAWPNQALVTMELAIKNHADITFLPSQIPWSSAFETVAENVFFVLYLS